MLPIPSSSEASVLADWVEASCLLDPGFRVSKTAVHAALEAAGMDDEGSPSFIWLELGKRGTVLGDLYPFSVEQGATSLRDAESIGLAYRLLLLLSIRSTIVEAQDGRHAESSRLFEHLVAVAARQYLGGRAKRIGSPRYGDIPKSFSDLIPFLCGELSEGPAAGILNPASKDAGADVIAWRGFDDRRAGQVVLIAQCATGADWTEKAGDCSARLWRHYMGLHFDPVTAFAVPHVELEKKRWIEFTLRGGVFLDRLRLVKMSEGAFDEPLKRRIERYCSGQYARLSSLLETG